MVIGIIGENCTGKSTIAQRLKESMGGDIVSGKDYLRLAKSESEGRLLFKTRLNDALSGDNVIYVISEPDQVELLPEGAVRILVSADLDTIKERFRARMRGVLPSPIEKMLERKHGMFDKGEYDYRFDGVNGDLEFLVSEIMKNMRCGLLIRRERNEDHRAVEELVREAFWNVYRPGCSEHYVIHVLRNDPAFVKELDLVMEKDGKIIGQNIFVKAKIDADDGREIDVLTMGPICVDPGLKRRGYGKKLLDRSLEKAEELGFGAVLIEGNIDFYGKSGFEYASRFGIRYYGLPEGADSSFFLLRELKKGYLDGVTGEYCTPAGYFVNVTDVEEFDRNFPHKEKLVLPGQLG